MVSNHFSFRFNVTESYEQQPPLIRNRFSFSILKICSLIFHLSTLNTPKQVGKQTRSHGVRYSVVLRYSLFLHKNAQILKTYNMHLFYSKICAHIKKKKNHTCDYFMLTVCIRFLNIKYVFICMNKQFR